MDRTELRQKLLDQQGHRCFICDEELDEALSDIEVDHIVPRAKGGKDDENNYAAVHARCNRSKSDSDLRVARCLARYERLKKRFINTEPARPHLGDFLREFGGALYPLRATIEGDVLTYAMPELDERKRQVPVYHDQLSGERYAFLTLPLQYLHHDNRINPRAVGPRIRGLLSEFLAGKPQLHVALAWGELNGDRICVQVFDGQHKAVAQILLGVRELPVRLFINPDLKRLLEANTNAGTSLKQVAFDQATQRFLGSQLYWEKIDHYRQATRRPDDDMSFSEQNLLEFFRGEKREITRYILDDVRIGVIHHPDNKLRDFIEFSGKETEKPLSYSTIEKTAFSLFICKRPLLTPLGYQLDLGENPRQLEKEQLVRLLNILAETIYLGKYSLDLGSNKIEERLRKGEDIPDGHLAAVRLSREEVLFNILRYVRELIRTNFAHHGHVIDDADLFHHKFPEELWTLIGRLVANIASLPVWVNKHFSGTIFGGKQDHEYWKIIFSTGRDRAGQQVLAKPLNINDLIR